MNQNNDDERFRSQYSTRTWRGCCIVPIIASVALLILTFTAGLFDRPIRTDQTPERAAASPHRQEFIEFGKAFFAIAQTADEVNEQGFRELDKFSRERGNASGVKSVFRRAAAANQEAARNYRNLRIPLSLDAQTECREAVSKVGQSFTARQNACEIIVRWADDPNNQEIAQEYARYASDVNTLTQEGLAAFAEAAKANGVTEEDARQFLPEAIGQKVMRFDSRIGDDAGVRKLGGSDQ